MLTKNDYLKLSKERLAELLVERDELNEQIEDKIAEKLAEILKDFPKPYPFNPLTQQPNPYPTPLEPAVLYGCPTVGTPDVWYGKTISVNQNKQGND